MSRTFVIGDVHGCLDELDELLDKAAITQSDQVLLVGDVIGRGPNSVGVVARLRALGARAVQGNHERSLLKWVDEYGLDALQQLPVGDRWSFARQLQTQDWDYLKALPMFVELPQHEAVVVHAGIVPGVALADQDPGVMTNIRSFDANGQPSARLGTRSWAAIYAGSPHVVFGHSAQRRLQLHAHATGLDTGCVYGGHLTGLLLSDREPIAEASERHRSLVSVAARSVHCAPKS